MTVYALIGGSVAASLSGEIYRAFGLGQYDLLSLSEPEVFALLESRAFRGLNVTMPYKETVIPLLSKVDPTARAVGAVNTVLHQNGRLVGFNTDVDGFLALAKRTGVNFAGKSVAILGTGGAAKSAAWVAENGGAKKALFVSRAAKEGAVTYEELYARHADAQILVNATPVGSPADPRSPVELEKLPDLAGVIDLVYAPFRTRLIIESEKRGIVCAGGLYMLVAQAARAFELFTGAALPPERVETVYRDLINKTRNLILVGMPGAGKSTVGKILAEKMARPYLDTDRALEERFGKKLPGLFFDLGEKSFREAETELLREKVLPARGVIVATGGGAVEREENRRYLREAGTVYYLARSPHSLPLSETVAPTPEKRDELYARREALYRAAADRIVPEDLSSERAAQWIIGDQNK